MKLSVIIPVYNVAPYLPKCLEGVLAAADELRRRGDGWGSEIICVNDGSTDESAAVLARFAAEDRRIRVITQANGGVSVARNAGLAAASGEWIHFHDSDDFVSADFYSRVFKRVDENPEAEVVVTAMKSVYVDGSSRIPNAEIGVGVIRGDILAGVFRNCRMGVAFCMADKVCKRRILSDNGIRFMAGLHSSEDSLCCQSVLAHANCICVDAENNGYCYWHHRGSLTTKVGLEKIKFGVNAAAASIALWRDVRTAGALAFARMQAVGVLFAADKLDAEEQSDYVEFLAGSNAVARQVLPFLALHGSSKSRAVGAVLWMAPRFCRGAVLKFVRRMQHG